MSSNSNSNNSNAVESTLRINASSSALWSLLSPVDFIHVSAISGIQPDLARYGKSNAVTTPRHVLYKDNSKSHIDVLEINESSHTLRWRVNSHTSAPLPTTTTAADSKAPAAPAAAAAATPATVTTNDVATHSVVLRAVGGATDVTYRIEFAKTPSDAALQQARAKLGEYLRELAAYAALPYTYRTTADDVLRGREHVVRGRNVLITGANSGIGFDTARAFAAAGAHVIVTVRDHDKGKDTVSRIRATVKDADVEYVTLSLQSLASVRSVAAAFVARNVPLHTLILNAGLVAGEKRETTADGLELTFGVNHVAGHALTVGLLPALKRADYARVVVVSSLAHTFPNSALDFDNLQLSAANSYNKMLAYCRSKTANILFATHLNTLLAREAPHVTVTSLHPGVIITNIIKDEGADKAMLDSIPAHWVSTAQGAATSTVAAVDPAYGTRAGSGKFLSEGLPFAATPYATDAAIAERLWNVTEQLVADAARAPARAAA